MISRSLLLAIMVLHHSLIGSLAFLYSSFPHKLPVSSQQGLLILSNSLFSAFCVSLMVSSPSQAIPGGLRFAYSIDPSGSLLQVKLCPFADPLPFSKQCFIAEGLFSDKSSVQWAAVSTHLGEIREAVHGT